ncbi:hypothetical protein BD779DRAFT_1803863 [Infundibulicybe gibba]|nr:hypothetical protein BD779DRAFT_1803863 [Infundibulicybe gibba]
MEIRQPVVINLPWEQLRMCALDHSEVALYVLQHAKNLRRLHLDLSELEVSEEPVISSRDLRPCHLGLNTLTIDWNFYMDPDINFFFSSITLPALQTLEICFDYPDTGDEDIYADQAELGLVLARFFERSCMCLGTLELTDIPFSQSALIKCLAFSPSLISLDIQFDSRWHVIGQTLLRKLNVNHPGHILPRLSSLSLRGLDIMSTEESLNALITSRRDIDPEHHDSVALLENLTLECKSSESEYPQFQQFVSEGLNVSYEMGD